MGGKNPIDRVKDGGVECSKVTFGRARPGAFWFPPEGHPLEHPRGKYPIREEMVLDIMERGVTDPVLAFEDVQPGGVIRLIPLDGSQRIVHAEEAERRSGQPIKIEFHLYDGGNAKNNTERIRNALRERALRNLDPHRKPDSPSALAHMARAMQRVGMEPADILLVMPRHVTAAILDGLLRWPHLSENAASAIDSGKVPLRQLGALLDLAPADQDVAAESGVAPKRQRTEKPRRPHPKALAKMAAAAQIVSGADVDRERAALADGISIGLRIAAGDPEALNGVAPSIKGAIIEATAKKRKEASHGA